MKLVVVVTNPYTQNLATIHGYHIVTDFFQTPILA